MDLLRIYRAIHVFHALSFSMDREQTSETKHHSGDILYFSFAGGLMLFFYAFHREDSVIMLGQLFGLFIYARNIYLIWLHKRLTSRIVALSAAEQRSYSKKPVRKCRNFRGMCRYGLRSFAEQPMSNL